MRKTKKLAICLCVSTLMTILCAAALMTELALPAEALTSNDVVYYGNYKQSGTSPDFTVEPILWRVLEASGDRALMLSEKIIDGGGMAFHPVSKENRNQDYYLKHYYITWWSESSIRLFLNGSEYVESSKKNETKVEVTNPKDYNFYDTAFNGGEGNAIIKDTVDNSVQYGYKVYDKDKLISHDNFPSGPDTEDKIFLLSYADVDDDPKDERPDKALGKKYGFDSNNSHIAEQTDYAKADRDNEFLNWWLSSPGKNLSGLSCVTNSVIQSSIAVHSESVGLRPAFRLNLKSLLFTSPAEDGKQSGVTTELKKQEYNGKYTHQPTSRDFTEHKLTLATSKYKLDYAKLTSGDLTLSNDVKVGVTYSGASTGDGYYLAAVVTSGDKALYYGQIKSLETEANAAGTAEFTIPELNDGEEVYVFVEGKEEDDSSDRNKLTDFASLPICLNGEGREIVATSMVESIAVEPSAITLKEEEVHQLTVTFAPEGVEEEEIEWSSGNESIATVSTDGLVTALKPGTATITATAKLSGKTDTCVVTVTEKPKGQPLTLSPTAMTISEGKTDKLTATFRSDIPEQPLVWTSSDEKIATVDENGTVTAISEGKCTITAKTANGTYSVTCEVTVIKENQPQNNKGGGSGGCNTGIPAVVTLLTLGSLIYIRSRNGK